MLLGRASGAARPEKAAVTKVIRVNPIACDGHGLCAELLPERITLDDWGYPVIDPEPIPRGLEPHARRAAAACPTLALLLEAAPERRS
jgi:ferredoxin